MLNAMIRRLPLFIVAGLCMAAQTPPRASEATNVSSGPSCIRSAADLPEQPDPSWDLLDQAVPPCHRVLVTLRPGTRLRLEHPLVSRSHRTGVIELKTSLLGGFGIYDLSDRARALPTGATMWISLNLCEMRATRLLDANNRPVERLRDASILLLGSDVEAIAHSDELPDAPHFCRY